MLMINKHCIRECAMMVIIKQLSNIAVVLTMIAIFSTPVGATNDPRNRIDFWQNNYDELKPSDDPLARSAHDIFERVLNAAGHRPGVVPRLFIINSQSDLAPLACAIPDGTVIISKKVLTICYQDPKRGDDRLAFLLGHEIAHQLKDDFWHMLFFRALALSESQNPEDKKEYNKIRAAAQETDNILAKEIQADEHGIVYAAMAGFDTRAIVIEDEKVNFFQCVAAAMDPTNIKGVHKDPTHPSPEERAKTIKARLEQVVEKTDLYDLGLLFYQAGDFEKAALFFFEFQRFFPSREVYHNLATCHHQLALKYYQKLKNKDAEIPFKLSIAIDPATRASQIRLRASNTDETLYRENMAQAIKHYQTAIDQDPAYCRAYNNLGCALVIKGEVYKAIGLFKDALKLNPNAPQTLNNLGVAFYLAENPAKAKEYLNSANRIDPAFGAPLFNLGKIAHLDNEPRDAGRYWQAYLEIDSHSPWAETVRDALSMPIAARSEPSETMAETTPELEVGDYEEDVPSVWGRPIRSKKYHLKEEPFTAKVYANGHMTLSQDDEIIVITTLPACKARTVKGIGRGDNEEKVADVYGPPHGLVTLSKGNGWLYPSQGIAFVMRGKKVSAWTLF
jgi:tetratricopeptide (TPR) repeat protein